VKSFRNTLSNWGKKSRGTLSWEKEAEEAETRKRRHSQFPKPEILLSSGGFRGMDKDLTAFKGKINLGLVRKVVGDKGGQGNTNSA